MNKIYINKLDLESFTHMLDDPTECYKFYWFDALLDFILKEKRIIDFDEIINQMIVSAWYSVSEYHLHLGLKGSDGKILNSLERAINILLKIVDFEKTPTEDDIFNIIIANDELIKKEKRQIAKMVPYRLLSSFMHDVGGNDKLWDQQKRLIAYIVALNKKIILPYTINDGKGLKKQVVINNEWYRMIRDNYIQIKSWIKLKKVTYLQDRNPGVPGIIFKLEPEREKQRKLKNARKLWLDVLDIIKLEDIYTGKPIKNNSFELDHFVPWSYVTNDELWNLMPIEGSINSSKSNKLPVWDIHFDRFARNQYELYRLTFENNRIMKLFCDCKRDNLISIWANEELYVKGYSIEKFIAILKDNIKPIYDSARIQGYAIWNIT